MTNLTPIIAALCRMYGKQVVDGGYEIYVPAHITSELTPTGQIQCHDDVAKQGFRVRYLPNKTIEGRVIESKPSNKSESLLLEEEKAGS